MGQPIGVGARRNTTTFTHAMVRSGMILVLLSLPLRAGEPSKETKRLRTESTATSLAVRFAGTPIDATNTPVLQVALTDGTSKYIMSDGQTITGSTAGVVECGVNTYADPNVFSEDPVLRELLVQAGMAEGETAWATFELPAARFPITLESMEIIFAQNHGNPTTTGWSLLIWDGPPDNRGFPAAPDVTSDGSIVPHVSLPAPNTARATILRVVIDPADPEPILIFNDTGTNMFSIGFRIESLNNPPESPCTDAPDPLTNAFPTTDNDSVSSLTGNWLGALGCGGFCDGINQFVDLPLLLCRPSGDWTIRATFSCTFIGACCDVDAACTDDVSSLECAANGGTFMGDASTCGTLTCPAPIGACCFQGVCLPDNKQPLCEALGGVYLGNGTNCSGTNCSLGACCMPDGSCDDLIDLQCVGAGGTFEGASTSCATANCPQPIGACCIDGISGPICFENQPRDSCEAIGVFNGADSTCVPDPCLASNCPTATIISSVPASGTIDARQPHPLNDNTTALGIGSANEPIVIDLGAAGAEACFVLCETVEDTSRGANGIQSATDIGGGVYEIVLRQPITPGGVTTIRYLSDNSTVQFAALPGDSNADSVVNPTDVAFIVQALTGTLAAPDAILSMDLNRSGQGTPVDMLTAIDLINGGGAYDVWFNQTLVTVGCP